MQDNKKMLPKIAGKQVVWVCLGVFLIGFGNALLRISGMGTDPFCCMNLGVSSVVHMDFGTYQLLVNIVLFIPQCIFMRRGVGVGTIVNMVGVAYVSDASVFIFGIFGLSADGISGLFFVRLLVMLLAIVILCLGIAIYMECSLGIAPYDALGEMIPVWTKQKIKFFAARVMTDVVCVVIGFLSGSVIGVATVITAFFTGPVVALFRSKVKNYLKG